MKIAKTYIFCYKKINEIQIERHAKRFVMR